MRGGALNLAALAALAAHLCSAQTFTDCNPTKKTCPNSPGLNQASYSVDLTNGIPDGWAMTSGAFKTSPKGGLFQITSLDEGPTIASDFHIHFGSVEITMQAAPGKGIVSTYVLESMDLDEIDVEIIGSETTRVQSNYFGKGNTTTYDRGGFHAVNSPQTTFHTYKVDWKPDTTTWSVDGKVVRTLHYADAVGGKNYPQTPCNIRIGNWVAGRPGNNGGTIQWAGGLADMSKAPFNMYVTKINIQNYNPCAAYDYSDRSGDWRSIKCVSGPKSSSSSRAPIKTSTQTSTTSTSVKPVTIPTSTKPVTTSTSTEVPVYTSSSSSSTKAPVYTTSSTTTAAEYPSKSSSSSEAPQSKTSTSPSVYPVTSTSSSSGEAPVSESSKTPCPSGNSSYSVYPHSTTTLPIYPYPTTTSTPPVYSASANSSSSASTPVEGYPQSTSPCPEGEKPTSGPAPYQPPPATITVQPMKPSEVAPPPPPPTYGGGANYGGGVGEKPPSYGNGPLPPGDETSPTYPSQPPPPPPPPPVSHQPGSGSDNGGNSQPPPSYGGGSSPGNGGSSSPPPPTYGGSSPPPPSYGNGSPPPPSYGGAAPPPPYGGPAPNGTAPAPSGTGVPHPVSPFPGQYTGGASKAGTGAAMGTLIAAAALLFVAA